jgi:hypothetical protein
MEYFEERKIKGQMVNLQTAEKQFRTQLDNFGNEVKIVTECVCVNLAIDHAASKSGRLLSRLNKTPTFWIATQAAFEVATYITLGRIFDNGGKYNINLLLNSAESGIALFQRDALAQRKREGRTSDPDWLDGYLNDAYYPTEQDFAHLRKKVEGFRSLYMKFIQPARNKHIAHRERLGDQKVSDLYGKGKNEELWGLTVFLQQLAEAFRELHLNGREPKFHDTQISLDEMLKPTIRGLESQVRIVRETKELMEFIEKATPCARK